MFFDQYGLMKDSKTAIFRYLTKYRQVTNPSELAYSKFV